MKARQIPAATFKARCLALLDEVQQTRAELVITKRGRPVARLVPMAAAEPKLFGRMAGTIEITGDIVSPVGESWDAER